LKIGSESSSFDEEIPWRRRSARIKALQEIALKANVSKHGVLVVLSAATEALLVETAPAAAAAETNV
jgi:hypothetical protein